MLETNAKSLLRIPNCLGSEEALLWVEFGSVFACFGRSMIQIMDSPNLYVNLLFRRKEGLPNDLSIFVLSEITGTSDREEFDSSAGLEFV